MFNTNKTLEQKVKARMATSLHFIEHYIIIRPSEPHIAELTPLHCQDSQSHLNTCSSWGISVSSHPYKLVFHSKHSFCWILNITVACSSFFPPLSPWHLSSLPCFSLFSLLHIFFHWLQALRGRSPLKPTEEIQPTLNILHNFKWSPWMIDHRSES